MTQDKDNQAAPIQSAEVEELSPSAERGVDYIMAAVQSFADQWRDEPGFFGNRVEALNTKARIRRMLEDDARALALALAAVPAIPDPLGGIEILEHPTLKRAAFANDQAYALYMAERASREQPADVIAFGASLLGHASTTDGMDDNEARAWVRCRWAEWQGAQPAADVSAPTDDITLFDVELMEQKFPLPETRYNGCGDGSEPLYTPDMMYAYAHQFIVAMAHARKPELDKALAHIAKLGAAARAAAPVSGPDENRYARELATALWEKYYKDEAPQWKVLPDTYGALSQIDNMTTGLCRAAPVSGQGASESIATNEFLGKLLAWINVRHDRIRDEAAYNAIIDHITEWADSRPRSEDSRAKVLTDLRNVQAIFSCAKTGQGLREQALCVLGDAIRTLATTATPSGPAQEQAVAEVRLSGPNEHGERFAMVNTLGDFDLEHFADGTKFYLGAPSALLTDADILHHADVSAINWATDERRPDNATIIDFARAIERHITAPNSAGDTKGEGE